MGDAGDARGTRAEQRALLGASLLAVTLYASAEMALATMMPVIVAELGGRALYGAVFFAYLLASLVGLVLAGGQAARRGPAKAFALSLAVFAAGLVLGALAPGMGAVVAGRALQGLGGGGLSATVLVVVNRAFGPEERPRVLAANATAWVVPALLAPAAAGWVAELASWRWVFAGLLPLVALAALLGVPAMRRLGPGRAVRPMGEELLDGLRLAAGLGLALGALARPLGPLELVSCAGGAALAVAPLRRVLPEGVLRLRPGLPGAVATKGLLVFAFFGAEAFVPLALVEIHGVAPALAGLTLSGAALCWTAGAHLQARLAPRLPASTIGALGASCVAGGIAVMLALLDPRTPLAFAFAGWSFAGFGMGIGYNAVTLRAMDDTTAGDEGATSTALGIVDALGVSLATGLGGALVAAADRWAAPTATPLAPIWGVAVGVAVLAACAATRLGRPAAAAAARDLPVPGPWAGGGGLG